MDLIEVILTNFRFQFRRLYWKEEFALQAKGRDERRVLLAAALVEISGLKVNSFDEAYRVLEALPMPILHRVFIIYKGKQPGTRQFTTRNLYKAPNPAAYGTRLAEDAEATEQKADALTKRMEQQFGAKELQEAAEVDRKILQASKFRGAYRGAVRKYADEEDTNPMGGFKVKPNA
jgi:hypothetical protein